MKYRIKDHELQRKLDEATDGEFSRRLQTDRERMGRMILIGCMGMIEDRRRHNHTKHQRMTLCFAPDEIEEVAEYDPHKWNDFHEVEPPEDVWMRVERCVDGRTYHFAARYVPVGDSEDYEWLSEANLSIDVDRFRPWDEEDEEDEE